MMKCMNNPKATTTLRSNKILLESADELALLGGGLVSSVTELGRGVDPFELNLLESSPAGVGEHALAEGHDPLLDTGNGTLEEHVVVLDVTIADEATEGSDGLLGNVELGGSIASVLTLADAVDLVVDAGTVVVTHLTGTGNSPLDVGWMPGTDTSNLAETLVRLARKLLGSPTGGDTVEAVALGDGDAVNHLILLENGVDGDGLLEEAVTEGNLVGNGATIDLNLHQMGLLLLERSLADLRMGQDTDDSAVLLDTLKLSGDG